MSKKSLGRYILDRKLATGGMAEIWVGHQQGPAGFEKEVVIKQILPHLGEDPKFIDMFLDEARLAAKLSHPNIVQIFDLGQADGVYFIAMEFIDGRDVQTIIERCIAARQPFSPAIAARVVADACTALDYAHNFTDRDGTHVQLVHRDVSPQNILVSNDGIVKLVDFGVAKAATSTHKTQTGAVKGKLSYMSPEQISGKLVDARSDIFALGIVLYELVTGRRPFGHESELLAITAILNENPTRPCEVIVDLPLELEAVILRALEKDPAQRFQTASEMHLALEHVLRRMGAILTSREVRAYVDDLFSESPTGTIPALSGLHVSPAGQNVTHAEHPSAATRPEFTGVPQADALPGGTLGVKDAASTPVSASISDRVYLQGNLANVAAQTSDDDAFEAPARKGPLVAALVIVLMLLVAGAVTLFLLFGPGSSTSEPNDAGGVAAADTSHQGADAGVAEAPHTTDDPLLVAVGDTGDQADAQAGDATGASPGDTGANELAVNEGSGLAADGDAEAPALDTEGDTGMEEDATAAGDTAPEEVEADSTDATLAPDELVADTDENAADTAEAVAAADTRGTQDEEREERPPARERDGTIQVVVPGGRADIFIDGRRVGGYPGGTRFSVSAGRHAVRVVSGDGETFNSNVTVEGGETSRVRVRY